MGQHIAPLLHYATPVATMRQCHAHTRANHSLLLLISGKRKKKHSARKLHVGKYSGQNQPVTCCKTSTWIVNSSCLLTKPHPLFGEKHPFLTRKNTNFTSILVPITSFQLLSPVTFSLQFESNVTWYGRPMLLTAQPLVAVSAAVPFSAPSAALTCGNSPPPLSPRGAQPPPPANTLP